MRTGATREGSLHLGREGRVNIVPASTFQNRETDPSVWVDKYGDFLLRYAIVRVNDRTLAEDLVQDTFLAALKGLKDFRGQSSVKTWLTGIIKYKIMDHYRKSGRTQSFTDVAAFYEREVEDLFGDDGNWNMHSPDVPREWQAEQQASLERKEFWVQFRKCSELMPEKMRQVYLLREVDEFSSEEICNRLEISRQNLWTILHRARGSLRRCLEKNWFAPPR